MDFKENNIIQITIPLDWVSDKSDILTEKIASKTIDAMEDCENLADAGSESPGCVPAGVSRKDIKTQIAYLLENEVFSEIPTEFTFDLEIPEDLSKDLPTFFNETIGNAFTVGALVLCLLLFFMGLIIFKPLIRVLKWEAKAFFLSSLFVLIVLVGAMIALSYISYEEIQIYLSLFYIIVKALFNSLIFYIAPVFILSFILWIIGIIYDKKHDTP